MSEKAITLGLIQGFIILLSKIVDLGGKILETRKNRIIYIPCPRDVYNENAILRWIDEEMTEISYDPEKEMLILKTRKRRRRSKRNERRSQRNNSHSAH